MPQVHNQTVFGLGKTRMASEPICMTRNVANSEESLEPPVKTPRSHLISIFLRINFSCGHLSSYYHQLFSKLENELMAQQRGAK